MKLEGRVAMVTGGGGSIGRAIAKELAREGCRVVVADVNLDTAREVSDALAAAGGSADAVALDVRCRAEPGERVAEILRRHGRIDILVNCAGGSARRQSTLFHESRDEVFDEILGVNLLGVVYCTRAAIGHMMERGSGRIVNIASIVALQGKVRHVDYAAAKGGVLAFSRALALEAGPHGITVNCVSPGLVPRGPVDEAFAQRYTCVGRVCLPEDVAHMVVFLCTDEAAMITGQNHVVDGGRSLGLRGD